MSGPFPTLTGWYAGPGRNTGSPLQPGEVERHRLGTDDDLVRVGDGSRRLAAVEEPDPYGLRQQSDRVRARPGREAGQVTGAGVAEHHLGTEWRAVGTE